MENYSNNTGFTKEELIDRYNYQRDKMGIVKIRKKI